MGRGVNFLSGVIQVDEEGKQRGKSSRCGGRRAAGMANDYKES